MPSSLRPASRDGGDQRSTISRRTATTTTRVRGPAGVSTVPSDCKSRIASSIGIGMWSGACADGGGERLLVVERRQVERADDDPLVGDAEPDAVRAARARRRRLQRLGQGGRVGHLAVAQHAGTQGSDGAALERQRAVDVDLGGGEMAGIEVEPDDGGLGGGALLEHVDVSAARGPSGLTTKRARRARFAKQRRSGLMATRCRWRGSRFLPAVVQVRVTLPSAVL